MPDEIEENRSAFVPAIGFVKRVLVGVTVLVGLLLLDGQLGPISFPLRRLISVVLLMVILLLFVRPQTGVKSFVAAWVMLTLLVFAPISLNALLVYVLVVTSVAINTKSNTSPIPTGLSQVCFAYVCIQFLPDLIPQLRFMGETLSTAAHQYLLLVTGSDYHLSPTVLGGPAIVLSTVYLLWRWKLDGSRMRLFGSVAIPIIWFLSLPLLFSMQWDNSYTVFVCSAYLSLFWVACAVVIDMISPVNEAITKPMRQSHLVIASLAALFVGITLAGGVPSMASAERNILVYNRGGLDWDRPVFGKFGMFSGGMFGLFPVYAQANGYHFAVHDKDAIQPEDLSGVQTFVLINSPKLWDDDQLNTIRAFVARGGSLLVLGDHTDVFGIMEGTNRLLDEFGIEFQFDSAYMARKTWRGCLAASPDAVGGEWDRHTPGIGVGASLKLRGTARALLCGRYGHSDKGIRENVMGSFLGNYHYDQGEGLGDTVLIASATHGQGRVIVFGDTSPFQGGFSYSLPNSVGPVLALLSRPTKIFERPLVRANAAVLVTIILVSFFIASADAASTGVIVVTLFAGFVTPWMANKAQLDSQVRIDSDCVLIDSSHLPATGHYAAMINPSGPLRTNLLRCGLRIADFEEWDSSLLEKAKSIAFIAPQRSFTSTEVEDLLRFEKNGGITLLAVGYPDSAASQSLLSAHGLQIAPRPLGTIPRSEQESKLPRFLDAWPIVSTSDKDLATVPDIEIIFRTEDDVTALFCRHGRGGLLMFSDTRFFSSMNVEGQWGHRIGNLALIHDVFSKYLMVTPDTVRPVFRSPVKPQ